MNSIDEIPTRYLADIHFIYGFTNGNASAAAREYHRRFPTRPVINRRVFSTVHRELQIRGIQQRPHERFQLLTVDMEEDVLEEIYRDTTTSVRRIAIRLGLPRTTVWKILKRYGLHPFHFRNVQNLIDPDYRARSVFCAWLLRQNRQDPNILKKILWTDESSFNRNGITNARNLHTWSDANPHLPREASFQHQFAAVNVWAGIIDHHLVGPYVLPDRLNGEHFLSFLRGQLPGLLEDVNIRTRREMYFQMDGAPPHYSANVRNFLNRKYPQRWIGRNGPIHWPARSPDLTPLDFYLWGHMKQLVYATTSTTREELITKIHQAAEEIKNSERVLRTVTQSVSYRALICLNAGGGHFENLIN